MSQAPAGGWGAYGARVERSWWWRALHVLGLVETPTEKPRFGSRRWWARRAVPVAGGVIVAAVVVPHIWR